MWRATRGAPRSISYGLPTLADAYDSHALPTRTPYGLSRRVSTGPRDARAGLPPLSQELAWAPEAPAGLPEDSVRPFRPPSVNSRCLPGDFPPPRPWRPCDFRALAYDFHTPSARLPYAPRTTSARIGNTFPMPSGRIDMPTAYPHPARPRNSPPESGLRPAGAPGGPPAHPPDNRSFLPFCGRIPPHRAAGRGRSGSPAS